VEDPKNVLPICGEKRGFRGFGDKERNLYGLAGKKKAHGVSSRVCKGDKKKLSSRGKAVTRGEKEFMRKGGKGSHHWRARGCGGAFF